MSSLRKLIVAASVLSGVCGFVSVAQAADDAAVPAAWADSLKFYGHAEGGVALNPAAPSNSPNFGNLFTDKANQLQLNQLLLTAERPIDTTASKFDFGFKLQALFGTDARYTHSLAETDHLIRSKYQANINEATVNAHIPTLFTGGFDIKLGQFPSPMGAEVIDAENNSLYSHSYIFNYGLPAKNAGLSTVAHVSPVLDLYGQIDTGVNGGITAEGDMNHTVKGQFGFGLNLLGGDLTVLALSHVGAENSPKTVPGGGLRYLNDITTVYKLSNKIVLTNDINYIQDDGLKANGYGMAQYVSYALSDKWSFTARGEVWRDNNGMFVSGYPSYFDAANAQRGLSNTSYSGGRTTYGALTIGANYRPEETYGLKGFVVRPELRVDHSLNNTTPFNNGKDGTSFTPAVDVMLMF